MAELSLYFNYNSNQLQWLLLAPGLINWVTGGTQLGMYHNYVEMDIDDTFTPDDAWDPTTHEIDYSDGDSLRMNPEDVITSAEWSRANNFRLDQLFNFGSTVADENGTLAYNGSESAVGPTRSWPPSRPRTRPRATRTRMTSGGSAIPTTRLTWTWGAPPRTTSRPS